MGKKSVREDKNAYQQSRERAGLTREAAGEAMAFVTADRIEKIESERTEPRPEEVIAMGECYKDSELHNYYCTHECPIGKKYIREVRVRELSQITLEMLAALNAMEKEKNRLIEITADGRISEDETKDFALIRKKLDDIAFSVHSLSMWLEQTEMRKDTE